jgi:hypothetical protein
MNADARLEVMSALMIPADNNRNLPDGSQVNIAEFLKIDGIYEEVCTDLENFSTYLEIETEWSLKGLTQEQFGILVKSHRKVVEPLLKKIGPSLLKAYYTNPVVQLRIGVGNKPPFPDGKTVHEGNLELLEPVFNRGPIFRETRDGK